MAEGEDWIVEYITPRSPNYDRYMANIYGDPTKYEVVYAPNRTYVRLKPFPARAAPEETAK